MAKEPRRETPGAERHAATPLPQRSTPRARLDEPADRLLPEHLRLVQLQRSIGNRAIGELAGRERSDSPRATIRRQGSAAGLIQRRLFANADELWADSMSGNARAPEEVAEEDSVLESSYRDAAAQVQNVWFVPPEENEQVAGRPAETGKTPTERLEEFGNKPYFIRYERMARTPAPWNTPHMYAGMMVHELGHVGSGVTYHLQSHLNAPAEDVMAQFAEFHAPESGTRGDKEENVFEVQAAQARENLRSLQTIARGELGEDQLNHVSQRIEYGIGTLPSHYETVVTDLLYYLKDQHLDGSKTYGFARRLLKEANSRRREEWWSGEKAPVAKVDPASWFFQFWKW